MDPLPGYPVYPVKIMVLKDANMQFTHLITQSIGLLAPLKKELAYLDPGTGSFLLQLLLATSLGALFIIKTFWKRIKGFFTRLFSRNKADANPPAEIELPASEQPGPAQPNNEQQ